VLNRPEAATILEEWACELELRNARPPQLNSWSVRIQLLCVSRAVKYRSVMWLVVI
jgi:hypothetical protein